MATSYYLSLSQGASDANPFDVTVGLVSNAAADVELRVTLGNDTLNRKDAELLAENILDRLRNDPTVVPSL